MVSKAVSKGGVSDGSRRACATPRPLPPPAVLPSTSSEASEEASEGAAAAAGELEEALGEGCGEEAEAFADEVDLADCATGEEEEEEELLLLPNGAPLLPAVAGKRCGGCNALHTPLWRNGPLGAKTLCNACGVRDNRKRGRMQAARAKLRKPSALKAPGAPKGGSSTAGGKAWPPSGASSPCALPLPALRRRREDTALCRVHSVTATTSLARHVGGGASYQAPGQRQAPSCAMNAAPGGAAGWQALKLPAPAAPIPTPQCARVEGYEELYPASFALPASLIRARSGAARLWGPQPTAAALYCCDADDAVWLAHANAGCNPGGLVYGSAAPPPFLTARQLERLVDLFEVSSWELGRPLGAQEARDLVLVRHGCEGAQEEPCAPASAAAAAAAGLPSRRVGQAAGAPSAAAVAAAHAYWSRRRAAGDTTGTGVVPSAGLLGTRFALPPAALRRRPEDANPTQMLAHAFVFNAAAVVRQRCEAVAEALARRGGSSAGGGAASAAASRKRRRRDADVWASGRRKRPRARAAEAGEGSAHGDALGWGRSGDASAHSTRRLSPLDIPLRLAPHLLVRQPPSPIHALVTKPRSATPRYGRFMALSSPLAHAPCVAATAATPAHPPRKPMAVWGGKPPTPAGAAIAAAVAAAERARATKQIAEAAMAAAAKAMAATAAAGSQPASLHKKSACALSHAAWPRRQVSGAT